MVSRRFGTTRERPGKTLISPPSKEQPIFLTETSLASGLSTTRASVDYPVIGTLCTAKVNAAARGMTPGG
jgi:hypothetical protein